MTEEKMIRKKKVHVRVPIFNSTSAFSVIYVEKQADNACNLLFNSLTHCTWISNSVSIFSIKQWEKNQVKIQAYSWRFTKADAQVKGDSSRRLQALGISMHYNQTTGRDAWQLPSEQSKLLWKYVSYQISENLIKGQITNKVTVVLPLTELLV